MWETLSPTEMIYAPKKLGYKSLKMSAEDRAHPERVNDEDIKLFYNDVIRTFKTTLVEAETCALMVGFKTKLRSFVYQVGCARVHEEPEENIAELRLFHSTTIGYFAKLQDQYVKKKLEVQKLRHYISALEFRHLLEHLTPPCEPGTPFWQPNSGPRWMQFWEEALHDEFRKHAHPTLPIDPALTPIVEARNPRRGTTDATTGEKRIHKIGQNGQLYRTGMELYGILSDEIHGFPATEFSVEDDDGWTILVTEMLRALKPLDANINHATGEVDWEEERKRYLLEGLKSLEVLSNLPFFNFDFDET
jgi:hypothetical protein